MSQYVKVTRPGQCYSYICRDPFRKAYFQCSDDNWREGDMPIRDKTYLFICSNIHPTFRGSTLATIEDIESGQRYVIDTSGLQVVVELLDHIDLDSRYLAGIDPHEGIIREEPQENSNKQMNDEIKVGDLVIVTKSNDSKVGQILKICRLNDYGYKYVACNTDENTPRYGYNDGQIVKYYSEPQYAPGEKPMFSVKEILEILEQDKPAEEILLDIKDHITN